MAVQPFGGRQPGAMTKLSERLAPHLRGFHTDMPLYHGGGASFGEFKAVPTSADGWVTPGVSTALNPAVANEFAANVPANPQVYKLFHRADNPAAIDYSGEPHHAIVATLRDAFDAGRDAVMIRNYTTPGGIGPERIIIVRDANQLRSPNAAFEPAKRDSANLLAGIAGLGMLPPFTAGAMQNR